MTRWLAWALAFSLGCAWRLPGLSAQERAWLVAPQSIPGAFLWRQRVELSHAEQREVLDVALQKRCDELILAVLAPLAPAPIVLVQRGRDLAVSGPAGERGSALAQRMLLDLERAYFLQAHPPAGGSGATHFEVDGQEVLEQWKKGRLRERSVRAGRSGETLVVTYGDGWDPAREPARASLDDRRRRIRADIETVSRAAIAEDCETR